MARDNVKTEEIRMRMIKRRKRKKKARSGNQQPARVEEATKIARMADVAALETGRRAQTSSGPNSSSTTLLTSCLNPSHSFKERDRKRLEEKRKEDDRRDREEREKRKRDGRDARRRSKEEERRQKDRDHLITADAEKKRRHQEERELKRKKEEERELRKKKEEEERDIKRKKEEEIRRKRKEESKEKKRQQRMEKEQQERERKRASSLKEKQSPRYERTENNDAKEKDGKPKKAFGLLPLPHLSHAHSFLPSSPRRTGSSALSAPPQQISPRRGTSPSHNQQPHQPHQQQYQGGAFLPNSEIMHHGIHPSAQSALGMHDNTTIPTTREKES